MTSVSNESQIFHFLFSLMAQRSRNWCFTINNPTFDDAEALRQIKLASKWMIVGNEKGEAGTHHFQGFVMFKNAVRLSTCRGFSPRAHWEIARGSWEDNKVYCSKEGDFITYGTEPATQKRKGEEGGSAAKERWKRIRQLAKEGKEDELEEEFPRELTLFEGHLNKLAMRYGAKKDLPSGTVCGVWIYGPSGTGKTYTANNLIVNPDNVFRNNCKDQYWDGFDVKRHVAVVVDDVDPYMKSWARDFKIWVQEYEFRAPIKNDYRNIRPLIFIFTSNYRIDEVWEDRVTRETMHRRFEKLYKPTFEAPPIPDPAYSDGVKVTQFDVLGILNGEEPRFELAEPIATPDDVALEASVRRIGVQ